MGSVQREGSERQRRPRRLAGIRARNEAVPRATGKEGARANGRWRWGGSAVEGQTLIVVRVVCGGDGGGRGFCAASQGLERRKRLMAEKRVVAAPAVASVSMAGARICCRAGCGGWAKGQRKKGLTATEAPTNQMCLI
jgi:hypothetical protein